MGTLRDQILAADDLPREQVATDEWAPSGVPFVYVRGLSAAERDDWEQSVTTLLPDGTRRANPKMRNTRAKFAALVMVEEDGTRIFPDGDRDGIDRLANRSALVLERIAMVGLRLSGMVEANGTNPSEGDQDESPSSDSALPSE